jgi:DNA mismatch repair protein MSH5
MVRPSLYATSGGRTGAYSQTAGTPLRDRYRQILDSEQGTRNSEREHSSPLQRHDVSTLEISMRTEVIMALDLKEKETIGCAFFRAADGVLSVSGDVTMASLEIAHQFIEHVQPTTVLVSARAPDSFIEFLELISDPSTAGMLVIRFLFFLQD